jgi:hypothetical protein
MKRMLAAVVLLTALGVISKLALKEPGLKRGERDRAAAAADSFRSAADERTVERRILERYRDPADRSFVTSMLEKYRRTAVNIERTDGIRGLKLLAALDIEAIYLYEKHPREFCRLRDCLTDRAAADLLLNWREYFGMKRADETDRRLLIAEIARLGAGTRRIASKYPSALPLILADPAGVCDLIEHWSAEPAELADALAVLCLISLEPGSTDLRSAIRTFEHHGPLALAAFRLRGIEGFALVSLYGDVLESLGDSTPLDEALVLLRVNSDYVDEVLHTAGAEAVARMLGRVLSAGLVAEVGGSANALRLTVDYGATGERALISAGADAADIVYQDFADPTLRKQAVAALAEHGAEALAILDKYAADPDFREILRGYGPLIIPPIARSDPAPETLAFLRAKPNRSFGESLAQAALAIGGENGQATIRTIKSDGIDRVAELEKSDVQFQEFLPLYDLIHLAAVTARGNAPTTGEVSWALVDAGFVIADVLSLAAVQPEGVVAAETARSELKAAAREAAKTIGKDAIEASVKGAAEESAQIAGKSLMRRGAETSTERLAKWWSVRSAGGVYKLLHRLPEAIGKMGLDDAVKLGEPLCRKAGLRLTAWTPIRVFVAGVESSRAIPVRRGLKYVSAQCVQASVGLIGFKKMEEYLASRRADSHGP